MAHKPAPKPEPIPATYRRAHFVASDPKAFDDMPPEFLRARKPEPEPTPAETFGARITAIYLGIAAALIVIALLVLTHS